MLQSTCAPSCGPHSFDSCSSIADATNIYSTCSLGAVLCYVCIVADLAPLTDFKLNGPRAAAGPPAGSVVPHGLLPAGL